MTEYFIYEFKIGDEKDEIKRFNIAIEKVFSSDTKEEREKNAIAEAKEMLFADAMFASDLKVKCNLGITNTRNLYISREIPTHPIITARWELVKTDDVSKKVKMVFDQIKHGTYHDPWGFKHE